MSMATSPPRGLRANAMGLFGDWVAGIATVAPSSSVAFTLALMISFAGLSSPFAVLVVGFGMLFVAVGYARLNHWRPNAGAPFVWVGAVVRPWLGFAVGFGAILGMLFANIGNIALAGSYLISVIAPGYRPSSLLVWIVSAALLAIVVALAIRGVRPSIRVQMALLVLEYAIVVLFVILALVYELSGHHPGAHAPSWRMFTPALALGGWKGIAAAAVPIAFLYLGWESTLVLSEETTQSHVNPGRAAILGTSFLILWYTLLTVVFQGVASPHAIIAHGTDVLAYAGTVLLPGPLERLLPIAVFVAVFGTTQLQLIASSRVVWAMARDKLLPDFLASLSQHQAPLWASLILGAIPALALIPYLVSTSANTAIGDVISAAGLWYLFMYAVIAFTSVWFYRHALFANARFFLGSGLVPVVGGLMMVVALIYGLMTQSAAIAWVGGLTILVCLVLGGLYALLSRHPYFRQPRMVYQPPEDAGFARQAQR
ncbi:MAG: APC family permease [Firmicutes bacterium]|nr:APC family permease [Bacillota bacterium]